MKINQMLCPKGLNNNPNKQLTAISFITIHNTGNYAPTATAKNNARYLLNDSSGREASWHAGDGKGDGNCKSIGIEICVNDMYGFKQACENTAWLVSELLKKYKLTIDKVKQHHDWSGKDCPSELRSGRWGISWNDFLEMVRKNLNATIGKSLDVKLAIDFLVQKGIISSPDYWKSSYSKLQYLDQLLINMAKALK